VFFYLAVSKRGEAPLLKNFPPLLVKGDKVLACFGKDKGGEVGEQGTFAFLMRLCYILIQNLINLTARGAQS